jgi:large subunit ribosomal protein L22
MNEIKSQVYAKLSSTQTSAKKIRIVMELIRNKDAVLAERILAFHPSKGARILAKALKSVIANAENNLKITKDNLIVTEVFANEAPMLKRGRPASRGKFSPRLKRRSHVVIGLSERNK